MLRWLLLAASIGPEGPAPTPVEKRFEERVLAALDRGGDAAISTAVANDADLLPALLDRWLFAAFLGDPVDAPTLERLGTVCARLRREPPLAGLPADRVAEWREALEAFRGAGAPEDWESVISTLASLGDERRVSLARLSLARLEGLEPTRARREAAAARAWAERSDDAALLALALSVESDVLRDGARAKEALEASRRAIAIHRRLEDRLAEAEDERAIAVARGRIGFDLRRSDPDAARVEFEEAVAGFTRAVEIAEAIGDEPLRARALRGRGSTRAQLLGQASSALEDLDAALESYERRGETEEAARVHVNLSRVLRESDPASALDHLGRGSRAFEEARSESREAAQCWQLYALALEERGWIDGGSPADALRYYRLAGDVFERRGERHWLAETVEGEARLHLAASDLRRAADSARRALVLYEQAGDPKKRGSIPVLILGAAAYGEGRYTDAERLYARALEAARRDGWEAGIARCLHWLGDLRAWQRRFAEATDHLGEARGLLAAEPVAWIEVTQKLAFVAREAGRVVEAERLFEEAAERAREARLPVAEARLLAERAAGEVEGSPEVALDRVEQARRALEDVGAPALRALLLGLEADAFLSLGRHEPAREAYRRVLAELRQETDPRDRSLALLGLAEACLGLDRIAEAVDAWREASRGLASLRPEALAEVWQIPLQERFDRLPALGVEVFVREGDDAGALAAAQDAQGRALADAIEGADRREKPFLDRLRARLRPNEAFVAYAEGVERLHAFVVRGERLHRFDLGPAAAVRDAARAFRERCESPAAASPESVRAFAEAGERLRDLAWTPLATALEGCRSVVVAPGASLAGVALEALPLEVPERAATFGEIRYALEDRSFSYVPSARVFAALADLERSRGAGLFAVADPDYGAATPEAPGTSRGVLGVVGPRPEIGPLSPLPHSRIEAEGVGGLFDDGEKVVRLGADARAEALGSDLERSRFVLLSVHGRGDEEEREASGLWLSPREPGSGASFFGVRDLEGRTLLADLVVLSACRTARGVRSSGEGVLSLAREFLRAGARAVLASEWLVADAATAEISIAFHEGVRRGGLDAAEALREAKVRYLRTPRSEPASVAERGTPAPRPRALPDPAHPFFWAPLLLFGPPR